MKKVILLMLIAIPGLSMAQQKIAATSQLSVAPLYPLISHSFNLRLVAPAPVSLLTFSSAQELPIAPKATSPVGPGDYYQQCFGYFCKREWAWEKQTKVPVKFRLGSYQEAQRIEGKH
ncbi:hypothetical protein SAMN05518672_1011715 [Chitinophaga sp. CF118]|uniref:hypothetical protein n=1 Tax=Chitinophaga sp. CF118 TaxID=1884367 RepID=UPI0008F39E77|nr:hypothetical protein [Chitinophaga sp. CF118]SFD34184.1 hypothetical protein SAMN05518672_1011715 [Chitinophaga sp. CF118]